MDTWSILKPFGIFNRHLVYVVVIWYTFPLFGMSYLCTKKSGNTDGETMILMSTNNKYTYMTESGTSYHCSLEIEMEK
jgi:hypothetical protein